jgi:hypothetical protein
MIVAAAVPSRALACAVLLAGLGACREPPARDPRGMTEIAEAHRVRPGALSVLSGTVTRVDEGRIEIETAAGDRVEFGLHEAVAVTEGGRAVGLEALREGEPVRATYRPAPKTGEAMELVRVEIDPDPAIAPADPRARPDEPPAAPTQR